MGAAEPANIAVTDNSHLSPPPISWRTDDPPEPGEYCVCLHLIHSGEVIAKHRRLEYFDGAHWPYIGPQDHKNFGARVAGWVAIPEAV